MPSNTPIRHGETYPAVIATPALSRGKQSRPAPEGMAPAAGLLHRLRLLAMTAAGTGAVLPSLAFAHPGHGAPLFHSHEWEIGLALVAAVIGVGFAIRAYRRRK